MCDDNFIVVDIGTKILLEIADDFIESVTTMACNLAKHRGSDTLEVKDLQLYLENTWDVKIPGFTPSSSVVSSSTEEAPRIQKRPAVPEVHKQRLAFVKKAHDQIQKQKQKQQEKKQ